MALIRRSPDAFRLPFGGGLAVLAIVASTALVGCAHDDGRAPLTNANMAPEVRDKNLPLDQRIANIQKDPHLPAPEKERAIRLLQMQAGKPPTGNP